MIRAAQSNVKLIMASSAQNIHVAGLYIGSLTCLLLGYDSHSFPSVYGKQQYEIFFQSNM